MSASLGSEFGLTPMGVEQIAARNAQRCCGDPADCNGPCSLTAVERVCVCVSSLLELEIPDVACPVHGLVPFLREALRVAA